MIASGVWLSLMNVAHTMRDFCMGDCSDVAAHVIHMLLLIIIVTPPALSRFGLVVMGLFDAIM